MLHYDKLTGEVPLPDRRVVFAILHGKYYWQTREEPGYFDPMTEDTALELYWNNGNVLSWDERTEVLENGEELDVFVFEYIFENGTLELADADDGNEPPSLFNYNPASEGWLDYTVNRMNV